MQSQSRWILECLGKEYGIPSQGLRVGRGQENDVIVPDDQISRKHANFFDAQGIAFVRDEGSTNGVYVNGKRINSAAPLRPGDRIQIGNTVLRIRASVLGELKPNSASPHSVSNGGLIIGLVAVFFVFAILGVGLIVYFIASFSATPTPNRLLFAPVTATAALTNPVPTVTVATPPSISQPDKGVLRTALMSAVLIGVPTDSSDKAYTGSGSIVDARGLILTNFHVVRDDNGKPYNRQDVILVFVNSNPDVQPDRVFMASVVQADGNLDLAMLKLIATGDGKPLPSNLDLQVIPLGNSDLVQIGDAIQVIGFPGLGGSTVTLTSGKVSGFLSNRAWIKTEAPVNPGNSGGMAINVAGELVGIPTRKVNDPETSGQLGLLRPINLAKPLIDQVKSK